MPVITDDVPFAAQQSLNDERFWFVLGFEDGDEFRFFGKRLGSHHGLDAPGRRELALGEAEGSAAAPDLWYSHIRQRILEVGNHFRTATLVPHSSFIDHLQSR